LDQENFIYYELIDFENKIFGLQKITYYQIKNSSQRILTEGEKKLTTSYLYYGLLGRWDKELGVWDFIHSDKESLYNLTIGNPKVINKGESLSIRSTKAQNLNKQLHGQILEMMPVYGNAGLLGDDKYQYEKIYNYSFDYVYFSSREARSEVNGSFEFINKNKCNIEAYGQEMCKMIFTTKCTFSFEKWDDKSIIPLEENQYNWIITEDWQNPILSNKLINSLKANVRKDIIEKTNTKCTSGFEGYVEEKEMTEKLKRNMSFALVQFAPFSGFDQGLLNTNPEFSCDHECGKDTFDKQISCPYKSDASFYRYDINNKDKEHINANFSELYWIINDNDKFKDRGISKDPLLILHTEHLKLENQTIKNDLEYKINKNNHKMDILIQINILGLRGSMNNDNQFLKENDNFRKNSFLYIIKKEKNVELKISDKKNEEIDYAFKIKLSHMGLQFFLIKFEDTGENFKLIKRLLKRLKGYYIVESAVKKIDDKKNFLTETKTYIIVVIQTFSNFGFLPFKNEFDSEKCEKKFYEEMFNQQECSKNSLVCKKLQLSKDADELYHQVKGYKSFANAINVNLTLIYSIRYEKSQSLKEISLTKLFKTSQIHSYLDSCNKLEFYLPINSTYKIKGQYRNLIPKNSNSIFAGIKEVMSNHGPEVKQVYWIRISSTKNVRNFYEFINYYAYTTLMPEDEKIDSEKVEVKDKSKDKSLENEEAKEKKKQKNFFSNVIISHDFRFREETSNICKNCRIVQENLFIKNKK